MDIDKIPFAGGEITVRVRDERDIPAHLDYLYNSPPDFLKSVGFAPEKFLPRAEMEQHIRNLIANPKPLAMAAEFKSRTVAMVFLDLKNQQDQVPRLHFHMFDSSLRGQGLGGLIFKAAVNGFYKIYDYRTFYIEPRSNNLPMNALMKKMGFRHLKDRTLEAGPMTPELQVSQYEILAPL